MTICFSHDSHGRPERAATTDALNRAIPQLVALGIIGGLALLGAAILAAWSDSLLYLSDADIARKATAAAWADILLLVGVISIVGAVVISGALEVGKRVVATLNARH